MPSPLVFLPIDVFAAILRMLPSPRCDSLRLRCVSTGMRMAVDDAFFLAHGPASQRNRGVVAVPPRIFLCPCRPAQVGITAPSLMRARRLMAAPSSSTEPHIAGGFRIHVLCRMWQNPLCVFPDRAHVAALAAFLHTEPCATVELIVDESFPLAGASAFRALGPLRLRISRVGLHGLMLCDKLFEAMRPIWPPKLKGLAFHDCSDDHRGKPEVCLNQHHGGEFSPLPIQHFELLNRLSHLMGNQHFELLNRLSHLVELEHTASMLSSQAVRRANCFSRLLGPLADTASSVPLRSLERLLLDGVGGFGLDFPRVFVRVMARLCNLVDLRLRRCFFYSDVQAFDGSVLKKTNFTLSVARSLIRLPSLRFLDLCDNEGVSVIFLGTEAMDVFLHSTAPSPIESLRLDWAPYANMFNSNVLAESWGEFYDAVFQWRGLPKLESVYFGQLSTVNAFLVLREHPTFEVTQALWAIVSDQPGTLVDDEHQTIVVIEDEGDEEEDPDGPVWEGALVHSPVGSYSGDSVSD